MIFYDTNLLLEKQSEVLKNQKFLISSITLKELENIKVSPYKSADTKYKARNILRILNKNQDKYEVIIYKESYARKLKKFDLPDTPDNRIIICALMARKKYSDLLFATEDLSCLTIARDIVKLNTVFSMPKEKIYSGCHILNCSEAEMEEFYINIQEPKNLYNLKENEYLLLKYQGNIIDKYVWRDGRYEKIPYHKLESTMFGTIKPMDTMQSLAIDSLYNNQFTVLKGAAGSGKTLLSLAYLFQELEAGKLDKIVIVCNPVAANNAARLGFTPGSLIDKLLDSQIGNILISHLGDRLAVEKMIDEGSLILIPTSNLRGFSCEGKIGYYITEAQNLDIYLAKLAIQRCGNDTKLIFEGDNYQTDMAVYDGKNNGMSRAIEVFAGSKLFGTVTLENIHRSEICELAQKM